MRARAQFGSEVGVGCRCAHDDALKGAGVLEGFSAGGLGVHDAYRGVVAGLLGAMRGAGGERLGHGDGGVGGGDGADGDGGGRTRLGGASLGFGAAPPELLGGVLGGAAGAHLTGEVGCGGVGARLFNVGALLGTRARQRGGGRRVRNSLVGRGDAEGDDVARGGGDGGGGGVRPGLVDELLGVCRSGGVRLRRVGRGGVVLVAARLVARRVSGCGPGRAAARALALAVARWRHGDVRESRRVGERRGVAVGGGGRRVDVGPAGGVGGRRRGRRSVPVDAGVHRRGDLGTAGGVG